MASSAVLAMKLPISIQDSIIFSIIPGDLVSLADSHLDLDDIHFGKDADFDIWRAQQPHAFWHTLGEKHNAL